MKFHLTAAVAALFAVACSSTPSPPDSGATPDSGLPTRDGGDAGADAGPVDAGVDAGPVDAGADAGIPDAGPADAGLDDAGDDDAGEPDAGSGSDAGGDSENNYNWSLDAGFFTAKAGVACLNLGDSEFGCYGEFKGYDGGCVSSSLFLTGGGDARAMTYTGDQVCPCTQDLSIRFAFPADSGYSQFNYQVSACDSGSDGGLGGAPILLKTFDINIADCH